MFTIDTRTIPADESLLIDGELEGDPFGLVADGLATAVSPLKYKAEASEVSGNLLLRGRFIQALQLGCVRCVEPFEFVIDLVDHSLLLPLGNSAVIDLTDALREDILLALPSFPRCDQALPDGTPAARDCPAAGNFGKEKSFEPLDPDAGKNPDTDGWGALDQLNID